MLFNLEDIMKQSGLYLVAKDTRSKFIYSNENFCQGLGLDSSKGLIGKNDFDFFEHSVAKMYQEGDALVLRGGVFINVQEIHPQVGKTIKILTTKNQIRNRQGETAGIVVTFLDVTNLQFKLAPEILKYNPLNSRYEFMIGRQTEYFTVKEYLVFKHVLIGFTAKQIAAEIGISYRTVEDYIVKIRSKLQCSSKFQIAETAMRLGLLQQNISILEQ